MAKHRVISKGGGQDVSPNILTVQIHTKVWLERSGTFLFGEGGLELLRQIDRLASLTRAAEAVGWSYRHAWGYLRNAERQLGSALTTTTAGKEPIEAPHLARRDTISCVVWSGCETR